MSGSGRFDFGANWDAFSRQALGPAQVDEAMRSLVDLLGAGSLEGRSFLDIGSGSGLFSIAAARLGARPVVGFDVSPRAVETALRNRERFAEGPGEGPDFVVGSVLDDHFLAGLGQFDTVYAWGSLHHTGAMWDAIRGAAGRVSPGGRFALAIYNRHWTTPAWRAVKRTYVALPRAGRRALEALLAGPVLLGAWATTGTNPLRQARAMDFRYNLIDWIGGYPYEAAGVDEIVRTIEGQGFRLADVVCTRGWTGCNEFVFERAPEPGA